MIGAQVRRSSSTPQVQSRTRRARPALLLGCGQSLKTADPKVAHCRTGLWALALGPGCAWRRAVLVLVLRSGPSRVEARTTRTRTHRFKNMSFIFKKKVQRVYRLIIIIIGPRVQYLYCIQHLEIFLVLLASVVFAGLNHECQPLRLRLL